MKRNTLTILLELVFLAVFNAVFFIAGGTEHSTVVWIAYSFIHFAYLMLILTPLLFGKARSDQSLTMPLMAISGAYFALALIAGIVFSFIKEATVSAELIVFIVLTGIYLIFLITNLIANTSRSDELDRSRDEIGYIKRCAREVKLLIGLLPDARVNRRIERVFDELSASPTASCSEVRDVENAIIDGVERLSYAVRAGDAGIAADLTQQLEELIAQRNAVLRTR